MNRSSLLALLSLSLVAAACGSDPSSSGACIKAGSCVRYRFTAAATAADAGRTGNAAGNVSFSVVEEWERLTDSPWIISKANQTVDYTITLSNVQNVTLVDVHRGSKGNTGPALADLWRPAAATTPGAAVTGELNYSLKSAELGPAALDSLVSLMVNGNAYIDVHTVANPTGEVRGYITRAQ